MDQNPKAIDSNGKKVMELRLELTGSWVKALDRRIWLLSQGLGLSDHGPPRTTIFDEAWNTEINKNFIPVKILRFWSFIYKSIRVSSDCWIGEAKQSWDERKRELW